MPSLLRHSWPCLGAILESINNRGTINYGEAAPGMADQNDTVHSEPIEYRAQHRRLIRGRASVAASALTPAEAGPV